MLKGRACLFALGALVLLTAPGVVVPDAAAQPRSTAGRSSGPAMPPSGHQTEAIDLNEGKSAAELFQAGCAVCHQSAAGLAKGRREGELVGFLRQHYTSGVQHASALAGFLVAAGGRGGPAAATPSRQAPIDRPPGSIGSRRPPADDDDSPAALPQERRRKPQEAARPPEREAPAKRRPSEKSGPATARTAPAGTAPAPAADAPRGTEAVAPVTEPAPASAPPVEEKPAPPDIPL